MTNKKWIKIVLSLSVIGLGLFGAFNSKVDSLGLVGGNGLIERASTDLSNNKILAGLDNYNDRFLARRMIEKFTENKDILVIGASRSLLIRSRNIKKKHTSFYNASVSNGVLGDFLNLIYIYEDNLNTLPNTIIFNLDPWIFNKGNSEKRYLEMGNIFNEMSNKINGRSTLKSNSFLLKYRNFFKIFSLEYVVVNFYYLINSYINSYQGYSIVETVNKDAIEFLKEPDGSVHYPLHYKNRSIEELIKMNVGFLKNEPFQLHDFNKISNKKTFENLLNYLVSKNVNIVIQLAPFNPGVFNELAIKYPLIMEVESFFIDFFFLRIKSLSSGYLNICLP
jgi:hypothetical protein